LFEYGRVMKVAPPLYWVRVRIDGHEHVVGVVG
jgi:hypothetical protein